MAWIYYFHSKVLISFCFYLWMCCSDLTMEIVRYRLIGPQSFSVLAETMEAATVCNVRIIVLASWKAESLLNVLASNSKQLWFSFFKEINISKPSHLWWPEQCKSESKMNLHQQQTHVFHILKGVLIFLFSHNQNTVVFYDIVLHFLPSD